MEKDSNYYINYGKRLKEKLTKEDIISAYPLCDYEDNEEIGRHFEKVSEMWSKMLSECTWGVIGVKKS